MVEDFEKKYTEFKVPYPENVYEEEFEKMTEEVKVGFESRDIICGVINPFHLFMSVYCVEH